MLNSPVIDNFEPVYSASNSKTARYNDQKREYSTRNI